jgi:hypothetical protein
MATAAAGSPGILTQLGMAGTAAVITVSFIHPIDVVKVCLTTKNCTTSEQAFGWKLVISS